MMRSCIVIICFFFVGGVVSNGEYPYGCNSTEEADAIQNLADNGQCNHQLPIRIQCRNRCTLQAIRNEDCDDHPYCCLNRRTKTCVLKITRIIVTGTDEQITNANMRLVGQYNNDTQNATQSQSGSDDDDEEEGDGEEGRNFQFPGAGGGVGAGAGFGTGFPPPQFPFNCQQFLTPQVNFQLNLLPIVPPVNIPYCQRIACNPRNPFLEQNYEACIAQPGCYYDQELAQMRSYVGDAILPGVPVCHLVIRNQAFRRRANEAAALFGGQWNPILTDCLLGEYQTEIFGPHIGCQLLRYLSFFQHLPKRAGWTNINERECALIGACWVSGEGLSPPYCAYPVNPDGMPTVRSSNEVDRQLPSNAFGLPSCFPFSQNAQGTQFLSSYHNCLRAGCATTVNRNDILEQLLAASSSANLSYPYNVQFISMIYSGLAGPDNYGELLNQIRNPRMCPTFSTFSNFFPNPPNPIIPNSFMLNGGARSGSSSNNASNNGTRGLFFPSGLSPPLGGNAPNPFLSGLLGGNRPNPFPSGLLGGNGFNPLAGGNPQAYQAFIASLAGNLDPALFQQLLSLGGTNNPNLYNPLAGVNSPFAPPPFNPCPYQADQYNIQGFLQLSGRFDGCCDQPRCYLPRTSLHSARSGISSYLSHWSQWSQCTQTCGGGRQMRSRRCVGDDCTSRAIMEQTNVCNQRICPTWSTWGQWSECTATCGFIGQRTRSRTCQGGPGARCSSGMPTDSEPCNTGRCPTIAFGDWSPCSSTCGRGLQTRTIDCTDPGDFGCSASQLDQRPCEQFCGSRRCHESKVCCLGECRQFNGQPGHCNDAQHFIFPYCNECFNYRHRYSCP